MGSWPVLYTGLLAERRIEAGQAAQALQLLDDTLASVNEPGVGVYMPEIHRLRGRALMQIDPRNLEDAENEYKSAIRFARKQHASAFHLQAAVDRARMVERRRTQEGSGYASGGQ